LKKDINDNSEVILKYIYTINAKTILDSLQSHVQGLLASYINRYEKLPKGFKYHDYIRHKHFLFEEDSLFNYLKNTKDCLDKVLNPNEVNDVLQWRLETGEAVFFFDLTSDFAIWLNDNVVSKNYNHSVGQTEKVAKPKPKDKGKEKGKHRHKSKKDEEPVIKKSDVKLFNRRHNRIIMSLFGLGTFLEKNRE